MESVVPTGDICKALLTAWQLSAAAVDCSSASSMFLAPHPAWVPGVRCRGQPLLEGFRWDRHRTLPTGLEKPGGGTWQFRSCEHVGFSRLPAPPTLGCFLSSRFGSSEHTFDPCQHFRTAADGCSVAHLGTALAALGILFAAPLRDKPLQKQNRPLGYQKKSYK